MSHEIKGDVSIAHLSIQKIKCSDPECGTHIVLSSGQVTGVVASFKEDLTKEETDSVFSMVIASVQFGIAMAIGDKGGVHLLDIHEKRS